MSEYFLLDEKKFVLEGDAPPPGDLPVRVERPSVGWFPTADDMPYLVQLWDEYIGRDPDQSNQYWTNAVMPMINVIDGVPMVTQTKPPIRLDRDKRWIQNIQDLNTERILYLFAQAGYGFMDRNTNPVDPWVDEMKLDMITCCTNRLNGKEILLKSGNKFLVTETQRFEDGPSGKTYESHPHLVHKQVCAIAEDLTYRTANPGDVYWPLVFDGVVCHRLSDCWLYPKVPFDCQLYGFPVTITQLCFQGSNTFGLVSAGLEAGWYQLDGQKEHAAGEPGKTREDYFCNVSDVVVDGVNRSWPGPTAPIAGYQLE